MDLGEYLARAYDYTYWANGRYLNVAAGLPSPTARAELGQRALRTRAYDELRNGLVETLARRDCYGTSRPRGIPDSGFIARALERG